jgi:polysaccharide biosynthesis PFTS motif protein
MLSDWRPLALRVQKALDPSELSETQKSLIRDLIISHRRLHLKPEPEWKSLNEIPLGRGMSFDVVRGLVASSYSDKKNEVVKLLKYVLALSVSVVFAPRGIATQDKNLTLFYSDGFDQEKRDLFIDFIQEARFSDLTNGRALIIQDRNTWKSLRIKNHLFVKDIGLFLATQVLNRKGRARLLSRILKEILSLNKIKKFGYIGAHRVIAENTLWTFIFNQGLNLKIVATNSYMELLPTPFYSADSFGIPRYMIWYSNNNFSIPSEEGVEQNDNRIDFACRTDIDTHFVWTKEFADTISKRNQDVEVQVIGSIMMYPKRTIDPIPGKFKVAVFDMTPWQGYPSNMYGSELFMQSFLEDIVTVCGEFAEIDVYLKPKRKFIRSGHGYVHSRNYLKLIDELEKLNQLTILESNTNIYGLAEQVNLTLGFPFASPVIIGKELSKPSYYYNPEYSKSWKLRGNMDGVEVISGRDNLRILIGRVTQGGLQNS